MDYKYHLIDEKIRNYIYNGNIVYQKIQYKFYNEYMKINIILYKILFFFSVRTVCNHLFPNNAT